MEDNLKNPKKDYQAAAKRLLESDPFFPVTKIPINKEFLKTIKESEITPEQRYLLRFGHKPVHFPDEMDGLI